MTTQLKQYFYVIGLLAIFFLIVTPIQPARGGAQQSEPEAIISDLSTETNFIIHRGDEQYSLETGAGLNEPLFTDDIVEVKSGWVEILLQFGDDPKVRLEAVPGGVSYRILRYTPSAYGDLRRAVHNLFKKYKIPEEKQSLNLDTKGSGDYTRSDLFPPERCVATLDEFIVLTWPYPQNHPYVTIAWVDGKYFFSQQMEEKGTCRFSINIRDLLASREYTLAPGETLTLHWRVEDRMQGWQAAGEIQVVGGAVALTDYTELGKVMGWRYEAMALLNEQRCFQVHDLLTQPGAIPERVDNSLLLRYLERWAVVQCASGANE